MKKIFFIFIIILTSCNKKNEPLEKMDKTDLYLPNEIKVGEINKAYIDYNFEEHNIIKNEIGSGKISRFIHLYTSIDTFSINEINLFNSIKKDTFLTQDINRINFDFKINKKGKYYINSLIKDILIFDTIKQKNSAKPAKISEVILSQEILVE